MYIYIYIYTHIKSLCCLMQYSMIMKDLNELKWFDIIVSNWKEKSSYRWEKWVKDENRSPGHTLQSCYDDWNRCMSVVTFDRSELVNVGKTQKTDLVQDFFFDHMTLWYVHSLYIKSWFFCIPHTLKTANVELTVFMKCHSLIHQKVPGC